MWVYAGVCGCTGFHIYFFKKQNEKTPLFRAMDNFMSNEFKHRCSAVGYGNVSMSLPVGPISCPSVRLMARQDTSHGTEFARALGMELRAQNWYKNPIP